MKPGQCPVPALLDNRPCRWSSHQAQAVRHSCCSSAGITPAMTAAQITLRHHAQQSNERRWGTTKSMSDTGSDHGSTASAHSEAHSMHGAA